MTAHDDATPTLTRRGLLTRCAQLCALTAAAPLLAACAASGTHVVRPVNGRVELPLAQHPALADAGGSVRLLPDGHPDPVYVLAQGGDTFVALSPICTHLGCTVDIKGERLVCPCHGSTYDLAGRVLQGPAEEPLARFRTFVTTERILVIDLRSAP